MSRLRLLAATFLLCACNAGVGGTAPPPKTPAHAAFAGPRKEPLSWADFNAETFARAKKENRFVVLDGSAEWCHWCHVMEAITYHDPEVQKILREKFIAAKVDIDSRPDIEERYHDWGWPATVIFSPDGDELGKYKGYMSPEDFSEILRSVTMATSKTDVSDDPPLPEALMTKEQQAWIARMVEVELLDWYDDEKGGWGKLQKAPIAANVTYEIALARSGDVRAKERAKKTLESELALIDPVWGGMYQYSTDGDWAHPHYEKLVTVTAGALDNYADMFALDHDPRWLDAAKLLQRWLDGFMTSKDGAFFTTQDADLNAHDPDKPFLSGHDYYDKNDADRRALGIPRIDVHEYPRENGMVIAALCTLGTKEAIASAKRAAEHVFVTHTKRSKLLVHDAERPDDVRYLADNAHFLFGLVRLYERTKEPIWLDRAKTIADAAVSELYDERAGGFFSHTKDEAAVGVFAKRRKPLEDNMTMVRALARLDGYAKVINRTIQGVVTPERIKDRGRFLGELELALRESKHAF